MINRKPEYKAWVIQEIKSKSNASYREIIDYVSGPLNQDKLNNYYKQWERSVTHNRHYKGVRSMGEILKGKLTE